MSASLITPYYYCGLHLFVVNTISGYHGGVDLPSLAEGVIARLDVLTGANDYCT